MFDPFPQEAIENAAKALGHPPKVYEDSMMTESHHSDAC
jgi:hypothetical protein